jgi:hypothetical protein
MVSTFRRDFINDYSNWSNTKSQDRWHYQEVDRFIGPLSTTYKSHNNLTC